MVETGDRKSVFSAVSSSTLVNLAKADCKLPGLEGQPLAVAMTLPGFICKAMLPVLLKATCRAVLPMLPACLQVLEMRTAQNTLTYSCCLKSSMSAWLLRWLQILPPSSFLFPLFPSSANPPAHQQTCHRTAHSYLGACLRVSGKLYSV